MPRFLTKDLLIGMTLIAVGIGLIVYVLQHFPRIVDSISEISSFLVFGWYGGGALIGAGILTPFKMPGAGVAIGIVMMFVLQFFALKVAVVG